MEKVIGDIEIREVHFTYPSREDKPVLQGFSLAIQAGNILALVGSSGCGKSTVISLVQRFYDPISGNIIGHMIIIAETFIYGYTIQSVYMWLCPRVLDIMRYRVFEVTTIHDHFTC